MRCPRCDGDSEFPITELSRQGDLIHFRCRDCGGGFSLTTEMLEQLDGTPENHTDVVLESDRQPKGVPMRKIKTNIGGG